MAGFIGSRTSAFDYIGPDLPNNPQNGEMWFDTDGASDGTGEVKVYDGSNDAWEATGFTSHADLTDVTRHAHHPPVEVSGPLTQPSDQSLGLSVGDGLATASGALVAALGNGLGVDGSGQVYIPTSAVSQSMLGFDTATQSELDGHASASNPHSGSASVSDISSATGATIPKDGTTVQYGYPTDPVSGSVSYSDVLTWYEVASFSVNVTNRSFVRFFTEAKKTGDYVGVKLRWVMSTGQVSGGTSLNTDPGTWTSLSGEPVDVVSTSGSVNVSIEMQVDEGGIHSGGFECRDGYAEVNLDESDVA